MQIAGETLPAEQPPKHLLVAVGQAVLLKLYKQDTGLLAGWNGCWTPEVLLDPPCWVSGVPMASFLVMLRPCRVYDACDKNRRK